MKHLIPFVLLILIICSCEKEQKLDIEKLNGYWEIVQAQNPYGKNVIYKINTQVDYFEVKDSVGFRKKMKPDLSGNFTTSKAIEEFKVSVESDSLKLIYSTPYDNWTEVILKLNDSLMLVKNKKDFLYTYKRFEPIDIE